MQLSLAGEGEGLARVLESQIMVWIIYQVVYILGLLPPLHSTPRWAGMGCINYSSPLLTASGGQGLGEGFNI